MAPIRTVLCFGDSNTHGSKPTLSRGQGHRFDVSRRWPGVLAAELGEGWSVIEEGHPGRTTVHDDPIDGPQKNGLKALPVVLESHRPLDVVIVMLGTNDFKCRFSVCAGDIADAIEVLLSSIKSSCAGADGAAPTIVLIAPPKMKEIGRLGEMFSGGAAKSDELGLLLADLARRHDVAFLDASGVVESSVIDGIHLDEHAHRSLGSAVARTVKATMQFE
jgi:lysophospholipase L1-like esterase